MFQSSSQIRKLSFVISQLRRRFGPFNKHNGLGNLEPREHTCQCRPYRGRIWRGDSFVLSYGASPQGIHPRGLGAKRHPHGASSHRQEALPWKRSLANARSSRRTGRAYPHCCLAKGRSHRVPVSVGLVLDRSGSMAGAAQSGTTLDGLRAAVKRLENLMRMRIGKPTRTTEPC